MAACDKHRNEPYRGYQECPGCELEALKGQNDALWETLIKIADALDIDPEEARQRDGKPSEVFIEHIKGMESIIERLEAQVEALGELNRHERTD